jgi:integrase
LEVAKAENPLDHLLILVTYLHALRCSEAINLHVGPTSKRIVCVKDGKRSSIPCGYVEDGNLVVWRLKGSLRTNQPLISSDDPLFDERGLLSKYPVGPLFNGYSRHTFANHFRRLAKLAGLPRHLHFAHSLKHSVLFHALNAAPDDRAKINELQVYAGHRSGASTMKYLQCSEQDAAKSVVNALFTEAA